MPSLPSIPAKPNSLEWDAAPYTTVLSRRARWARRHPEHRLAQRWLDEAHDYLHNRTIPVPHLPVRCK